MFKFYIPNENCKKITDKYGEVMPTIDYFKKIFPKEIASKEMSSFEEIFFHHLELDNQIPQMGSFLIESKKIFKVESVCYHVHTEPAGENAWVTQINHILLNKIKNG